MTVGYFILVRNVIVFFLMCVVSQLKDWAVKKIILLFVFHFYEMLHSPISEVV